MRSSKRDSTRKPVTRKKMRAANFFTFYFTYTFTRVAPFADKANKRIRVAQVAPER